MTTSSLAIKPINHPLHASVRIPGSKSLTNRALLIASLANGKTCLTNALFSDDSRYFAGAMQTLGFNIQLDEPNSKIIINGLGGKIPVRKAELFIGNAGTAARFLSAFLTLAFGEYTIDGEPRMRERPINDLVSALSQLGAKIETTNNCPPVKISASGLPGGKVKISGEISSQFVSALLMVAPYAQSPVEIEVTDLNSKPFVDMTLSTMLDFGVEIQRNAYHSFRIPNKKYKSIITYAIESDATAASYFFAAPALCGGTVKIENISRDSKQGDIAFIDILQQMGCEVSEDDNCISVSGTAELRGIDIDMRDIPDTAQTLSALAPFASSVTNIRGIASARVKETDRVHATCFELARLGVQVEEHHDGLTIHPCKKFIPATIRTYNDHRMAMAFSLIGLRVPGVAIENPECVSKTFPDFFEVMDTLSG
jgi:3-phosphoshikimate 1-carboxyvinyltransferase